VITKLYYYLKVILTIATHTLPRRTDINGETRIRRKEPKGDLNNF
jgi:hypothetical protein